MPTRPAIHQPTFAKTPEQRAAAERERQRRKDADRPSSTERGYDAEWRMLRAQFITAYPTCSVPGCGKPTVDVDHIESLRSHPERRLDPSNLRPFCHAHHAQRTARDQGFAGRHESKAAPGTTGRAARYPEWMRPSRVPLRMVCGPPAAGQEAYVEEHAHYTEVTIDLDAIRAELSGLPFAPGWAHFNEAMRARNSKLGELSSPYIKLSGAWFIVPAPKLDTRAWWRGKLKPISVMVFATPAEVCHRRIDEDPRRELVRDQQHDAVERWWREYEPAAGERVVVEGK